MGFRDVNNQKGNAVSVSLMELVEGGNLPPEGRSGVAAKDQHHGPLPVQCGKLNRSAMVLRHQLEIRRAISHAQAPGAGMGPERLKREEHKNNWSGNSGHDAAKFFRRLAHGPPEKSPKSEIDNHKADKKPEQQLDDEAQFRAEIRHGGSFASRAKILPLEGSGYSK